MGMTQTAGATGASTQRLLLLLKAGLGYRGLPVFVGAVGLWIAVGITGDGDFTGTLAAAASVASFLALAGVGQLFVIAAGSGNIDLSVPYVLTFSAFLGSDVIDGQNSNVVQGVVACLLFGLVVGLINGGVILLLRIPPIVATLAVGFVIESGYLQLASHVHGGVGPWLGTVATGSVVGLPYMAVIAIVVIAIAQVVLMRSWFGRKVLGLGQSAPAARLSALPVRRLTVAVYVISAVAAALVGVLLGGYIGGGSLDMGTTYQLGSVAVVVLGGCLAGGGVANAPGVGAAAVFVSLLVTLTNLLHVSAGVEQIIEGVIIVTLLATVGKEKMPR